MATNMSCAYPITGRQPQQLMLDTNAPEATDAKVLTGGGIQYVPSCVLQIIHLSLPGPAGTALQLFANLRSCSAVPWA